MENVTTVYLRADGPGDTLHYIWDFVGNPSLLLAVTSPSAQLQVDWDDYLVNLPESVKFTETPKYTFGIVIQKVCLNCYLSNIFIKFLLYTYIISNINSYLFIILLIYLDCYHFAKVNDNTKLLSINFYFVRNSTSTPIFLRTFHDYHLYLYFSNFLITMLMYVCLSTDIRIQ